jgi:hypothetical protein
MTDRTANYVKTLDSFVGLCQEAAQTKDQSAMNRLGPVLVDVSQQAQQLEGILQDATD